MGLDISHGTWHGAYSAFHRWRTEIAKCLGIPLELMEGFYHEGESIHDPLGYAKLLIKNDQIASGQMDRLSKNFPLLWDAFKPNPLHELLYHSDCDGIIEWAKCSAIADELEKLLPELESNDQVGHIGNMAEKTKLFISGLRSAYSAQEDIEFR